MFCVDLSFFLPFSFSFVYKNPYCVCRCLLFSSKLGSQHPIFVSVFAFISTKRVNKISNLKAIIYYTFKCHLRLYNKFLFDFYILSFLLQSSYFTVSCRMYSHLRTKSSSAFQFRWKLLEIFFGKLFPQSFFPEVHLPSKQFNLFIFTRAHFTFMKIPRR